MVAVSYPEYPALTKKVNSMFTSFYTPESKTELYYKLNSSLQITGFDYQLKNYKFAGLYAIYKNNVCLYVGQSKNLARRISDHLSGRYSEADQIHVFYATGNGFSNFDDRGVDAQKSILDTNELKLIDELKPIENIITPPCGFNPASNKLFDCFLNQDEEDSLVPYRSNSIVYKCKHNIYVADSIQCADMDCEALDYHNEIVIQRYLIKEGK